MKKKKKGLNEFRKKVIEEIKKEGREEKEIN